MISACCVLCGWRLLHYFQLESYQLPGYWRSVKRNAQRLLLPGMAVAAAGTTAYLLGVMMIVRVAFMFSLSTFLFIRGKREKAKKPFVITERVKRLIAMHAGTAFAVAILLFALSLVLPAKLCGTLAYLLPAAESMLSRIGRS